MNEKTYDSNRRQNNQNMRCLGRIHAFPRPMGAFAHGYYTSGCARSHCPASQMWIRSGSATWRRQWHRNRTHPLTTPKQQTCQWERRWMIFFYRPKCSYRFIFFFKGGNFRPRLVRVLLVSIKILKNQVLLQRENMCWFAIMNIPD